MRVARPRGECQQAIDWENEWCVAQEVTPGVEGPTPFDYVDVASIFPSRPEEPREVLLESVVRPLGYQLSRFAKLVLHDPTNRVISYTYQTNIEGITHDYKLFKSENGLWGMPKEMGWIAEPYDDPAGRDIVLADALSLNQTNMPACVSDGYFIFRGGNTFGVDDDIDFVPGVNYIRDKLDQQVAIPATTRQVLALTAELTEISDHYAKYSV